MPPNNHIVHATGEDESRELRFTMNEDGSCQCIIWWGRGNKRLATLNFSEIEMQALRDWLDTSVD